MPAFPFLPHMPPTMAHDGPVDSTRLVIPSTPLAVRQALRALFDGLMTGAITQTARDAAQIVLAEALNNVVEHAYAQSPGEIEVTVTFSATGLVCSITDAGLPMPGACLPPGDLAPLPKTGDLPEGGFGWHLIRALSQDLHYRREEGRNLLSFRIDAKQFMQ
ncbi:MAG: ATP-binding protein [Rhodobacteraceae bacterium]|nr:ATP-binding protein [Paracoccaceae bacterium]